MVDAVEFADAAAGNLDLVAEKSDGNPALGVAPLAEVAYDIYGTLRGDNNLSLVYAGAYEGGDFRPVSIDVVNAGNGITIKTISDQIMISSESLIQSVKLYNVQGGLIEAKQAGSNECTLTAPTAGIYVVEIATENGRNVQKVAVKF